MDKQLIDIAHEMWAAAQLAPSEGIEDGISRIAAILARIDAERGKEAEGFFRVNDYGLWEESSNGTGTPLFLSPTPVPEGMAKDAERYRKLKSGDYSIEKFVSSSYGWTFVPTDDLDRTLDAAQGERK